MRKGISLLGCVLVLALFASTASAGDCSTGACTVERGPVAKVIHKVLPPYNCGKAVCTPACAPAPVCEPVVCCETVTVCKTRKVWRPFARLRYRVRCCR